MRIPIEHCNEHNIDYRGECPLCAQGLELKTKVRMPPKRRALIGVDRVRWSTEQGIRLRRLRLATGMLVTAFAQRCGISHSTYSNIEHAYGGSVNTVMLEQIAAGLGLKITDLT